MSRAAKLGKQNKFSGNDDFTAARFHIFFALLWNDRRLPFSLFFVFFLFLFLPKTLIKLHTTNLRQITISGGGDKLIPRPWPGAGSLPKNWSNCDKLLLLLPQPERDRTVWSSHVNLDHLVWCCCCCCRCSHIWPAKKKTERGEKMIINYTFASIDCCYWQGNWHVRVETGVCLDVTVRRFACEFFLKKPPT